SLSARVNLALPPPLPYAERVVNVAVAARRGRNGLREILRSYVANRARRAASVVIETALCSGRAAERSRCSRRVLAAPLAQFGNWDGWRVVDVIGATLTTTPAVAHVPALSAHTADGTPLHAAESRR